MRAVQFDAHDGREPLRYGAVRSGPGSTRGPRASEAPEGHRLLEAYGTAGVVVPGSDRHDRGENGGGVDR